MKVDLHVHTKYSIDSIIEPKALVARSRKSGVIPAITDHNNTDAHAVFRSLGADFIQGEEVRTDRGDLIGLYLNEPIPRMTPFLEAIDIIKGQGALAYLPHMYDRSRRGVVPSPEEAKGLDIVEIFNARCPFESFNEKAEAFADECIKRKAVGSDSHFLFEFGTTFSDVPEFDLQDPKGLVAALRKAKYVKKKATMLVRGTTTFVAVGKKLIKRLSL
jgi:predicted metal-dependent phosphoesterase TrpH